MKNQFFLLLATVLFCPACGEGNMNHMFTNDEHRRMMFSEIANNEQWSSEMMDSLMTKHPDQVMQKMHSMMMGDKSAQEDMMGKMMDNCDSDSNMCKMMASMMTNHKPTMKMMMGTMHEKGIMDEGCMQNALRNMDEAGDTTIHASQHK